MKRLRPILTVTVAVIGAVIAGAFLSEDRWLDERTRRAIEVERQIVELHMAIEALPRDGDDAAVDELINEMVTLDPDHPKPYQDIALVYGARRRLDDAPDAMDALGSADGPGPVYGRGMVHVMSTRLDDGLRHFEHALDMYREREHLAGQAACLTGIGIVFDGRKEYGRASESYEAVPPLLRKLRNRLDLAAAYANLARRERNFGRPELAAELQLEVVALRRELGDKAGEAKSWRATGVALAEAGDSDGAIEALGRALALRREIGDRPAVVLTLRVLAETRHAAGDTSGAIKNVTEAREIARSTDDAAVEALALARRGQLQLELGHSREAFETFETLASLHDEAGNAAGFAAARSWIGSALNRTGERERARRILEEVLVAARELEDRRLEAAALTELGVSLFYTGDIPGAFLTQQRALDLNRELDDKQGMLINHGNLAAIHYSVGDPRALDAVRQTLELAEETGHRAAVARAHNNLGVLLLEPSPEARPNPEGARRELETAAAIWRQLGDRVAEAETEGNLAEAEARVGEIAAASRRADRALDVLESAGDSRGQARLLNVVGDIRLLQGEARHAVDAYRAALSIARDHGHHDPEWRALAGLSEALESDGKRVESIENALLALDAVERVRARLETDAFKIRYLASRLDLYERTIDLVLASPVGPDATETDRQALSFQVAERARARGLLDLLAEGRSSLREHMPTELRRREEAVFDELNVAAIRLASAPGRSGASSDDLAAARTALEKAEDAFEQLRVEIRRAVPDYGELVYPVPATLDRVQSVLRPGERLLEYFVGRESSWVWTVDRDRVSVHELEGLGGEDWEQDISKIVAGFADPDGALSVEPAAFRSVAQLGPRLLPGLAASSGATRLIIVPDGALNAFPFELLPIEDELLIDRYEIGVLPSASTLAVLREHAGPGAESGFLGVGAPVVVGGDLPRLPFARQSLERIGRLFPTSDRDLLLGEGATKAALRERALASYRFIHFATHGWLYDDRLAGGLRLSGEAGDPDSLLTLREIPGLDLSADLVVLSSCRSGTGKHYRGEGLVSLTRAFLYAGARSVVVSLWNVSDESTADFMELFYRGLLEGRPPAAALRSAKLDFLHSDRPARQRPYRWAPFVLVGEPDSAMAVNRGGPPATVLREGE